MAGKADAAADQESRRRPWLRAVEDWLFGYDFFVSYQWSSGGKYAKALAEALEQVGFECFLDRSDFAVGDDWKEESRRALHRTEYLIVIATREALRSSTAVLLELEVFAARQRPILPIVFTERFSEDERREIPALSKLPDSKLTTIEMSSAAAGNPSKETIDKIASSFQVLRSRRRRKRALVGTLITLTSLLAVATVLAVVTTFALKGEKQQRETAMAGQLLARADLLRETDGPQLSNSLADAIRAYRFAKQAGISTQPARQAVEQALAITPQMVGAPWKPFEHPKCIELYPLQDRLVALNAPCGDVSSEQSLEVAVASVDERTGWKTVVPAFEVPIDALSGSGSRVLRQLLLRSQDGNTTILDLATGQKNALPVDPKAVIAISAEGNAALVSVGDKIEYWDVGKDSRRRQVLDGVTKEAWLSSRGRWIAWIQPTAQCLHLMFMSVSDGAKGTAMKIDGPDIEVSFADVPEDVSPGVPRSPEPLVAYAVWPENQVVQSSRGIDTYSPRYRGAVWLDRKHLFTGEPPDAFALGTAASTCDDVSSPFPPSLQFARPDEVEVSLAFVQGSRETWISIVDTLGPPHLMNVESGVPIIPISSAGGARHGSFSRDGAWFLAAYADKTARLWRFGRDVDRPSAGHDAPLFTASEKLRFTAEHGINDATFFGEPTTPATEEESSAGIVTSDTDGNIQLWASHQTPKTADDVLAEGAGL